MSLSNKGYFLNEYKVFEDNYKIVFKIPIEFMIDTSRENPALKVFKEINIDLFYTDPHTQIVTCLKK